MFTKISPLSSANVEGHQSRDPPMWMGQKAEVSCARYLTKHKSWWGVEPYILLASAALPLREEPGTHWVGSWMAATACPYIVAKRKPCPAGNRCPVAQLAASCYSYAVTVSRLVDGHGTARHLTSIITAVSQFIIIFEMIMSMCSWHGTAHCARACCVLKWLPWFCLH